MIVGIDAGKYKTKVAYSQNDLTITMRTFSSSLMRYYDLKTDFELSDQDYLIEFNDDKFFGGDLADREMGIGISYTDESKYHKTTLINVLTALHQIPEDKFQIVVGSPISKRTPEEKQNIINMLKGKHNFTLNHIAKEIIITNVTVSPEGAAGFYAQPQMGEIQGLDFGSTTTNHFYFSNGKIVNRNSGTFPVGDRNSTVPKEYIVEEIASKLKNKFNADNPTMIVGGNAHKMIHFVKEYFPKAFLPSNPIHATAIGFFKIGRKLYG